MIEWFSYRNALRPFVWPKTPPPLTADQLKAREEYMMVWHRVMLKKYRFVEEFNHRYVTTLPVKAGSRTLEIGAGLGSHLPYEDLHHQEYYALEYRPEFCQEIRQVLPPSRVRCADIHRRQDWDDQTFDRIVAIHVLEHLIDLPRALGEVERLLKEDGVLDVVIPCEGGVAHTLARRMSAERMFRKTFGMEFLPIHLNEHVNSYNEVVHALTRSFVVSHRRLFPLRIPIPNLNLCAGFRLRKAPASS